MNAPEVLEAVQGVGGSLTLRGERLLYVLPDSDVWLVNELKCHREELIGLLREEKIPPPMPPGVRLQNWEPKTPPVAILHMGIVTNVPRFITSTLSQLQARLEGKDFAAGNWSSRELVDRLEQVGVCVTVESTETVQGNAN